MLQNLLIRRSFIINSFEIYGGVSGLLDLGPTGSMLKDNIIDFEEKFVIYKTKNEGYHIIYKYTEILQQKIKESINKLNF